MSIAAVFVYPPFGDECLMVTGKIAGNLVFLGKSENVTREHAITMQTRMETNFITTMSEHIEVIEGHKYVAIVDVNMNAAELLDAAMMQVTMECIEEDGPESFSNRVKEIIEQRKGDDIPF